MVRKFSRHAQSHMLAYAGHKSSLSQKDIKKQHLAYRGHCGIGWMETAFIVKTLRESVGWDESYEFKEIKTKKQIREEENRHESPSSNDRC